MSGTERCHVHRCLRRLRFTGMIMCGLNIFFPHGIQFAGKAIMDMIGVMPVTFLPIHVIVWGHISLSNVMRSWSRFEARPM